MPDTGERSARPPGAIQAKGPVMSRPKNSGRPAGRAGREPQPATGSLSPKQQRAADIQQKLAGYKAQHRRQRRNRLILIVTAWTAAAALVAGLVVFAVTSTTPKAPPAAIEGVQTFSGLSANHVNGPVKYPQAPPAGGDHSPVPLNCAVYTEPVPGENAVHSLEHGAVWMAYDPQSVSDEELKQLREEIPSTYMILSPYDGLSAPVVVSAWGAQLRATGTDDPRVWDFISKYRGANSAPEPDAPCTGGLDGPGKVN